MLIFFYSYHLTLFFFPFLILLIIILLASSPFPFSRCAHSFCWTPLYLFPISFVLHVYPPISLTPASSILQPSCSLLLSVSPTSALCYSLPFCFSPTWVLLLTPISHSPTSFLRAHSPFPFPLLQSSCSRPPSFPLLHSSCSPTPPFRFPAFISPPPPHHWLQSILPNWGSCPCYQQGGVGGGPIIQWAGPDGRYMLNAYASQIISVHTLNIHVLYTHTHTWLHRAHMHLA